MAANQTFKKRFSFKLFYQTFYQGLPQYLLTEYRRRRLGPSVCMYPYLWVFIQQFHQNTLCLFSTVMETF